MITRKRADVLHVTILVNLRQRKQPMRENILWESLWESSETDPVDWERYQGSLGPLKLGLQAEVSAGTLVLKRAVRTSTLKPEPPLPRPLPFYFCSECVGKETCSALAPTVGRKVLR